VHPAIATTATMAALNACIFARTFFKFVSGNSNVAVAANGAPPLSLPPAARSSVLEESSRAELGVVGLPKPRAEQSNNECSLRYITLYYIRRDEVFFLISGIQSLPAST